MTPYRSPVLYVRVLIGKGPIRSRLCKEPDDVPTLWAKRSGASCEGAHRTLRVVVTEVLPPRGKKGAK